MMNINKSYIRNCFKQAGVQLTNEALEEIVRHLRIIASKMAIRCKEGNVKRLTSELMWIALGRIKNEH